MTDLGRPDPANPEHVARARQSPLGWGWFVSGGRYLPYRHVRYMDRIIVDAILDGCPDVLLEEHPRAGKSFLVSRFTPGWYLGGNPDKAVLHASWKFTQSERWGRRVLSDLDRWGEHVFGVRLDRHNRSAGRFGIEGHEGQWVATGATAGTQGEPADLLLTDDLVKGYEAVRSEVQLDNLADFCLTDLETRREDGCVHISIETPWHEKDPHGIWREAYPHRYRTVRLPAIAEEDDPLGREPGEALCPERISLARLEEIRDANPWAFNALYQCRPVADTGGIWKRAWWEGRTFEVAERTDGRYIACHDGARIALRSCVLFVVVDLATSEKELADYTAILACALTPENPRRLVLLDVDRRRVEAPEISPSVKRMMERWDAKVAYYEVRGNQKWGAQYARKAGIPAREIGSHKAADVRVAGDKVAVAHDAAPLAASGRLLVPRAAPWLAEWEHELLTFPVAAHDDLADVTAWACRIALDVPVGSLALTEPQATKEPAPVAAGGDGDADWDDRYDAAPPDDFAGMAGLGGGGW